MRKTARLDCVSSDTSSVGVSSEVVVGEVTTCVPLVTFGVFGGGSVGVDGCPPPGTLVGVTMGLLTLVLTTAGEVDTCGELVVVLGVSITLGAGTSVAFSTSTTVTGDPTISCPLHQKQEHKTNNTQELCRTTEYGTSQPQVYSKPILPARGGRPQAAGLLGTVVYAF